MIKIIIDNDFFLVMMEILSVSCLHPDKTIIATGQMGKNAQICVWNTTGIMKIESLLQGHTDGVGAMNFHSDGEVNRHVFCFSLTIFSILFI